MSQATSPSFALAASSSGVLAVSGVLSFETAAVALDAIRAKLADGRVSQLDLAGIEHSDSAGLSCILAVVSEASAFGRQLQITHLPPAMQALAQVCDVELMLA